MSETFLVDNIVAQIAEVRAMNRIPKTLCCDLVSLDCLMKELDSYISFPFRPPLSECRIFGLKIQVTNEPNFEVAE